jgi:hypothetical protein
MYQDVVKIKEGDEDLISSPFLGKVMLKGRKEGGDGARQSKQNESFFQN